MLQFLPKISSLARRAAGFTMIELLIVITILGILAVAVLSAINPIEQINRGRDTGLQSDAEQLLSAIDRYNAFQQYYPWQDGQADQDGIPLAMSLFGTTTPASVTPACPISQRLSSGDDLDPQVCIGSQELKESFITRTTDTDARGLFIYNRGQQGDSTYVCFMPQSGAFLNQAEDRCLGTLPEDLEVVRGIVCDEGDRDDADSMGEFDGDGAAVCLP